MSIAQPHVEPRSRAGIKPNSRVHVVVPVVLVGLVLTIVIGSQLQMFKGNLTGPVQFGRDFASFTHPPRGALVNSPSGYDAQFFYVQARDPLLLRDATVWALHAAGAAFRMQRVAYPALAFLIAEGQSGAIPFAMLTINVLVLMALAAGFAIYARRRGWSSFWAFAIALMPGMLMPVVRDLSDPLATASMLAGLLLWQSGRRWPASFALAVAVLTREVMMLAIVAVAAEACARAWRARQTHGGARKQLLLGWPVVVVPTLAFAGWEAYVITRNGGPVGGAGLGFPFINLVHEINWDFQGFLPAAIWDLVYLTLILAGIGAALISLRQRVTVTNGAACALAFGVLVPTLGDVWSDTRLSAPFLALVLIDGLQRRNRSETVIGAAAASMSIIAPLMIPGFV